MSTDPRDIVERLRSSAWEDRQHRELRAQAAAEIERLRAAERVLRDMLMATAVRAFPEKSKDAIRDEIDFRLSVNLTEPSVAFPDAADDELRELKPIDDLWSEHATEAPKATRAQAQYWFRLGALAARSDQERKI